MRIDAPPFRRRAPARHNPPTPPAITQQGERFRRVAAEREAMDGVHHWAKPKRPNLCGASNRIDEREQLSTFVETKLFRCILVYPPTLRLHSDPHNVARAAKPSAITWQGAIWDVGLTLASSRHGHCTGAFCETSQSLPLDRLSAPAAATAFAVSGSARRGHLRRSGACMHPTPPAAHSTPHPLTRRPPTPTRAGHVAHTLTDIDLSAIPRMIRHKQRHQRKRLFLHTGNNREKPQACA